MVRSTARWALIVSCLGVGLLAAAPAAAQQQTVVGYVSDSGGQPVAGATVQLTDAAGSTLVSAATDATGRYVFTGIEAGSYRLRVSASGFLAFDATLRIRPRQSSLPRATLTPQQHTREQVVVVAPPVLEARDYASGLGIDPQRVAEMSISQGASFATAIPMLSASAVTSHDNLVHLRGNELSLQLSINGVQFLDNTHPQFSPTMTPELFRSIELITGGFSPEFGSRFGGILDLHTRNGFADAGHGSVSAGGGDLGRGSASGQWGNHGRHWGYLLAGSVATSERFLNPPQQRALHDRGTTGQGMVRIDHRGDRDTMGLMLVAGGSDFDLPNTLQQQELGRDATKTTEQETFIGSWDRPVGNGSLSGAVYQRFSRDTLHPTRDETTVLADGRRTDSTYGAKLDYSQVRGRHVLKLGVDTKVLDLSERLILDTREATAEKLPGPTARRHELAPIHTKSAAGDLDSLDFTADQTGSLVSAYAQDEVQLSSGIVANFGLRVDRFEMLSADTQLSPRLNLAWDHGGRWRLHAAYNRFFAPPPIEYLLLSSQVAGAGLSPREVPGMTADHFELGAGYRLGRWGLLEATAFHRSSDNAFETGEIADTRLFVPVTFAHDEARGLELGLRLGEFGRSGLSGQIRYTLSKTEFLGPVSGGLSGEELRRGERIFPAFDQRHTLVAAVRYRHPRGVRASVRVRYGSGTPTEAEQDGAIVFRRLPTQLVLDASLGADLIRRRTYRLSLGVAAENLTDDALSIAKESELTPIQFGNPRNVSARLRLEF